MKRLLLISLAFLAGMSSFAEVVSSERASSVAREFARSAVSLEATSTMMLRTPGISVTSESDAPTYYIYNVDGGGFVIVAGDDKVEKILAYSSEGRVDAADMPANMKWWMGLYDDQVKYARTVDAPRHSSWDDNSVKTTATVIIEHQTASWNQESPYWNECPMVGNSRTLTGCVATAAAIACRFHEWPSSGTGSTPKYTTGTNRISMAAYQLGRTYDYSQMPLRYTSSATAVQKAAVAALMYDLGRGCRMDYGTSSQGGSGAYTEYLIKSLQNNFKFSKSSSLKSRSQYSDATWISMLQKDLRESGPIIYGGSEASGGGHQFIFDGCRDDNYFRVNWGWGGSGNGYFLVTKLGGSSLGYTFSVGQDAILGLVPDVSWLTPEQVAKNTSLSYSRENASLVFNSTYALSYRLEGPAGFTALEGKSNPGEDVTLYLSRTLKGIYSLSLTAGGEPYVLTIKK